MQDLFDALKEFMGSPTARTLYSVAKDFQTIAAAVLALFAARLLYRGVIKRIAFDSETVQTERGGALLERQMRRYGAVLRLQSQMRRLEVDASLILKKLAVLLSVAEGKADRIEWTDGLGFGGYDELEKAWRKIELFPLSAIFLIDTVRASLARTKESEARCLAERNETSSVRLVDAKIYRDGCADVERKAKLLVGSLEGPISELGTKSRASNASAINN
jgi:hypothetical protein